MDTLLVHVLLKAKESNKWVPVRHLVKHGLNRINLLDLEDEGLLLVNRRLHHGLLLKLTAKGYHSLKPKK